MQITMKATGGREASRERRAMLVSGKSGLPQAIERTRNGSHTAAATGYAAAPSAAPVAQEPVKVVAAAPQPNGTQQTAPVREVLTGREASRARRQNLVQGKSALRAASIADTAPVASLQEAPASTASAVVMTDMPPGRMAAQAMRAARSRNGRGDASATRPSGHVRPAQPVNYPPKVADTTTYAGGRVTGIRIGRGINVTGDEPGANVQITGSQYIGKETGLNPRAGGQKVGAARTSGGLTVTGTQVRSQVKITGDESNAAISITGEADQELADDVLEQRESGAYTSMQFQRQHNPHGHTVFGTNLGRSVKSIGSRERLLERTLEQTDGGLPISGTAVGRSVRVTGDESGSCRPVTGDQYLMPAAKQPLCATQADTPQRIRAGAAMARGGRADPASGEKVIVSETWSRQRITGVDVEYNANVSGDESGICAPITGTPYVGPAQYETFCATGAANAAASIAIPGIASVNRVTGDTPANTDQVTGTGRGAARAITGTPYYRAEGEADMKTTGIERMNKAFSIRTPQRERQMAASVAVSEESGGSRISGSFVAGQGKITGNQEFHFSPRTQTEKAARLRISGEGRVDGPAITGGAWGEKSNITGTEDYIASERNPSERAGKRQVFASSAVFKTKGHHEEPRKIVTGMVGWTSKSAAKVTLSGGAQG